MAGLVLAEGVVEITADTKGVGRQVAKDLDGSNGELGAAGERAGGSIFGGIMKSAAVLGGLAIVGNFLGGAVKGASDMNETVSKSQTIFGDYFSNIDKWTDRSAETLGLSKEAALDAATGFGNMFTQLGFAGQAASDMSRAVVQTSADLGSFNNLETSDVADRMAAAFRGEYDSLQALIPNINAARVEQEAMAATGKTNASELTAQEKAAAVLAIVQKDGAAAMGDFAKTADGAANTQKTLTASLEDQQSKLGKTLLPMWQGFLGFLTDTAIPVLTTIVDWIGQNAEWLGPLAIGLAVATAAVWLFNIALNANPIMLIITGLALLIGAIAWVATQTTFFQDLWTNVTTVIGNAWTWLWETVLSPVFSAIGAVFTWLYENVIVYVIGGILIYIQIWAAIFTWLWETVLSPVFGAIGAVFTWLYSNVILPIVGFIVAYIQVLGAVFSWLYGNVISPVFGAIGAAFGWIWANVISPTIGFITSAIGTVGTAVQSVFGGIGDFIGDVFRNIVSVIRGPINEVIRFLNTAIDGANQVGAAFGVNIPHIPMLAKGGRITGSGSVIVGERGPELLNLSAGASVVPLTSNEKSQGSGAGGAFVAGDLIVNEAEDPLGSVDRIAAEWRKWKKS